MYDSYGSLSYSRNKTYQRFVFAKEKNCLGERPNNSKYDTKNKRDI
ncbi:MAG: hypothetical protein IKP88_11330 [Lachnospiraceae bacterium]|nr:hypothetical protein [Lachnospiraceae bacterium]